MIPVAITHHVFTVRSCPPHLCVIVTVDNVIIASVIWSL